METESVANNEALVQAHYNADDLSRVIREGLARAGKPLDALTVDDLAPVDAFHIGGRPATVHLAQLASLSAGLKVLDIGSGLGGTARYLAAAHGCDVTGVDLTESFCATATDLSALVALSGQNRFRSGSALDLPFEDESFDVVWTEHVQMNIADKRRFYGEAARVLRPGGRLVFNDVFQGPGGAPFYPLPWADDASISMLCSTSEARDIMEGLGFSALHWIDASDSSRQALEKQIAALREHGPPPLGLHLVIRRAAPAKIGNFVRNLAEGRLEVVRAVLERRA